MNLPRATDLPPSDLVPVGRLLERAEKLKTFIRQHQSGGCRVLSVGAACGCQLCTVDDLVANLSALQGRLTALQAELLERGKQSAMAITGDATDCLDIETPVDAWLAIDAEIKLGLELLDETRSEFRLHMVQWNDMREKLEAAEAKVAALEADFASYKVDHIRCVEVAVDDAVRVHDEIEARRDGIEAKLEAAEAKVTALEAERDEWRTWAQFVYLGGGHASGTDVELRARVCETHDGETAALKDRLTALAGALQRLVEQARELRRKIGSVISVAERRHAPHDEEHLSMLRTLREWEAIAIRLGWYENPEDPAALTGALSPRADEGGPA